MAVALRRHAVEASLPGRSKTIVVEPVELPAAAPPPEPSPEPPPAPAPPREAPEPAGA
jgi:hypothetical protein